MNFTFVVENISRQTGGAYREADVVVHVDSKQPLEDRMASVFFEVLASYLDPCEIQTELILTMADDLVSAWWAVSPAESLQDSAANQA